MDNAQFTKDCRAKLANVRERLKDGDLSAQEHNDLKDQAELLEAAVKIMTYGTGQERRRFRRDYERRLRR